MNRYVKPTQLLDFNTDEIQALVEERQWNNLNELTKIKRIYNFVRNEIKFGYNKSDEITASRVLSEGYGQCNTKATLLMALLRAVNIPNRIHGFTIEKSLQKGAIKGLWYKLAPENILHSWVEVKLDNQWYFLEGVILDEPYLKALQNKFSDRESSFCGYGAFTEDFFNPTVEFNKNHTFIQNEGINQDFGLFDDPDTFYKNHKQKLSFLKRLVYIYIVRHMMNRNVNSIRHRYSKNIL